MSPPTRIAVAVSGAQSVDTFAPICDALIAVEPRRELVQRWNDAATPSARKIGQLPISWGRDRDAAVTRAHALFRWFGGGWKVNAELPGPAGFAGASQFVRPEDVAASIPCGPDAAPIIEAVRAFVDAGFTDVALVQVGDETQREFLKFAEQTLLPAMRAEFEVALPST